MLRVCQLAVPIQLRGKGVAVIPILSGQCPDDGLLAKLEMGVGDGSGLASSASALQNLAAKSTDVSPPQGPISDPGQGPIDEC